MLDQLINLDKSLLLLLNGSDSCYWDSVMWLVTKTVTWIPLALVLLFVILKNCDTRRVIFILVAILATVVLADQLSSAVIKPLVMRWRPTQDPYFLHTIDTVQGYRGGRFGFVSSHAANTFSLFIFLSLLLRSRLMTLLLLFWALLASYSRIYLGVHYPGDILCGALLGLVVGALVYIIYYGIYIRVIGERQFFSNAYTTSGFLHTDMHMLAFAFMITYCLILLIAIPLSA